ncbi:Lcl C-terminal domain-containing protein [Rheinheimera sp.]|uniref:Lcl C-terminal domain-containing protein n=1 Tax=Rheinheimera sp. TaxID=1869214 RepID=UPI00404884C7
MAHNGNGHAGFVFQKIDNSGNPLPAGSNSHTCVYDNHTGLTWEVKGGIETLPENEIDDTAKAAYANRNWFSKRNRYFWNNPDNTKNGGSVGGANGNEWDNFDGPHHISQNCAFISRNELNYVNVTLTGCASHKYVELTNRFARCGHNDWRMPTIQELSTLTRYESTMSYIDGEYFKDEGYTWGENMRYLSSTPAVGNGASVWCLNSDTKEVMLCNKQQYNYIRLVRGNAL